MSVLVPGAVPARAAVSTVETGVWWRNQVEGASLPAPPSVPAGGLWVSSNTTGATAVSAIRFQLPVTDADPTLKLKVAMVTNAADSPLGTHVYVLACVANSDWKPTSGPPGAWSARPEADCSKGQIGGEYTAGGSTMTFDLSRMVQPGEQANVVLLPGSTTNPVAVPPPPVPVPVPVTVPATPPVTTPELPAPLPTPPDPTASTIPLTFDITFQPVTPAGFTVEPASVLPADEPEEIAPFDSSFLGDLGAFVPLVPTATPALRTARVPGVTRTAARPAPLEPAGRDAARVLAAALLAALCGWIARALRGGNEFGERQRLTLADIPEQPDEERSVLGWRVTPRVGSPPALW